MHVLSLFSGAGGLDIGFEAAGFQVLAAVESSPDAAATLVTNDTAVDVYAMPVEEFLALDVDLDVDVVIGGPPCQPFSRAADWTGAAGLDDPRASTLKDYFDAVERYEPRVFVLENVPTFVSRGGLAWVEARARDLGYTVTATVLNAANVGAPQARRRAFVVGHRWLAVEPSTQVFAQRTAWDALHALGLDPEQGVTPATGKWAALLPSIPPGENYLYHTPRKGGEDLFKWRSRFWNFLLKAHPDQPVATITASPGPATGPFHWESRRFTCAELAALQTFPRGYVFTGSRRSQIRQIGNAVPCALAEHVAKCVLLQGFGVKPDPIPRCIPSKARTRATVPPTAPVPTHYRGNP